MMEKLSVEIFDENYSDILKRIDTAAKKINKRREDITLLAATKTVDVDVINHAISCGIDYIGENKVQEFLSKEKDYAPVHRHFIGHLQTNKVKDIVGKVELIHSVDSLKLAKEISKQSVKKGCVTDILLEVNIGKEESKSGFLEEQISIAAAEISELEGICIRGLMAIPPMCESPEGNRKYFQKMHNLFLDIKAQKLDNSNINILSMGMSDDFEVAISEGATLVRLGTALFGRRNYL